MFVAAEVLYVCLLCVSGWWGSAWDFNKDVLQLRAESAATYGAPDACHSWMPFTPCLQPSAVSPLTVRSLHQLQTSQILNIVRFRCNGSENAAPSRCHRSGIWNVLGCRDCTCSQGHVFIFYSVVTFWSHHFVQLTSLAWSRGAGSYFYSTCVVHVLCIKYYCYGQFLLLKQLQWFWVWVVEYSTWSS